MIPGHRRYFRSRDVLVCPLFRLLTALLSGPPSDSVNDTRACKRDTQEAALDGAQLRNRRSQTPGHRGGVGRDPPHGPPPTLSSRVALGCPPQVLPATQCVRVCTLSPRPHGHTPTYAGINCHQQSRGSYGIISLPPSLFFYPAHPLEIPVSQRQILACSCGSLKCPWEGGCRSGAGWLPLS